MLALVSKIKNNCNWICQDACADEQRTSWEDAVDDDIKKGMKDKDRWFNRTLQLEDDFSSYKGMVTTLSSAELSSSVQ